MPLRFPADAFSAVRDTLNGADYRAEQPVKWFLQFRRAVCIGLFRLHSTANFESVSVFGEVLLPAIITVLICHFITDALYPVLAISTISGFEFNRHDRSRNRRFYFVFMPVTAEFAFGTNERFSIPIYFELSGVITTDARLPARIQTPQSE